MTRRHVVLPEPEGPSMAKNSPGAISRSTTSMARTLPKWRETCWRETAEVIRLSPSNLLAAHHGDIVRNPARIGHAFAAGFALGGRGFPELDLVEIVEAVGGAAGFA